MTNINMLLILVAAWLLPIAVAAQQVGSEDTDNVDSSRTDNEQVETAAAQSGAAREQRVGQLPYEVIVRPRITRRDLRQLISKVEEDFFSRFNEINIDDAYDIVCYRQTPIMSHISERVCEPRFTMDTRNLNASEVTMLLGGSGVWTPGGGRSAYVLTPRTLQRENRTDYEVLQEKMEELTRTDAEFRSIGNALAELKQRLEEFGE